MAIDNFESGIRSVTYTRTTEGELIEQDPVEWSKQDYFVNLQNTDPAVSMEPFAGTAGKRKTRKRKGVAQETPAAVGDELITKATEKDLRKRGLK